VARGAGKCYANAKQQFSSAKRRDRGARSDALQRKLDQKLNEFRQIAKLLMRRGCKAGAADRHGMTPIMVAARTGAVGLISALASKDGSGAGGRGGGGEGVASEDMLDLLEKEDKGESISGFFSHIHDVSPSNTLSLSPHPRPAPVRNDPTSPMVRHSVF
jgi:hypothetical protein